MYRQAQRPLLIKVHIRRMAIGIVNGEFERFDAVSFEIDLSLLN